MITMVTPTRDTFLIAKGLGIISLLVGMSMMLSYGLASREDSQFGVRELMKEDYLLNRQRRDLVMDDGSTASSTLPPTGDATGSTQSSYVTSSSSMTSESTETGTVGSEQNTGPPLEGMSTENETLTGSTESSQSLPTEDANATEIPTTFTTEEPTTFTLPPTTTPLPPPCFRQEYQLQNACELDSNLTEYYGTNVTLEDVYNLLFISRYVDRLKGVCPPGQWCLPDDWMLRTDELDFLDFCNVGACLINNMPDDCRDDRRVLILSSLLLLCDVTTENITDVCFMAVRKMTHVTLVQQIQSEDPTKEVCNATGPVENCTGACKNFAQGLHCMADLCEPSMEQFMQYKEWRWYFEQPEEVVFDFCSLNNTDCKALSSEGSWFDTLWNNMDNIEYIRQMDGRVMAGVVVAALFALGGLAIVAYACAKKGRHILGYSRDIVEYQTVDSMEDDYDSS